MEAKKFAGVGLTNIIVIWLMCLLLDKVAKILVVQYKAPESVQALILS